MAALAEIFTIPVDTWQKLNEFDQVGIQRMGASLDSSGSVIVDLSRLRIHELYKLTNILEKAQV
jgi:hypothetical protein